jgi:hypothetical protein
MKNLIPIIIVVLLIGCGAYGSYYIMEYQKNQEKAASSENPNKPDDLEIIQPKIDPLQGKELIITPSEGGVLQVKTNQGVIVTLYIPPNAVTKTQTVSLVPFVEDGNPVTLDTGVIITPGSMVFNEPVTLSFSLEGSTLKNTAPVSVDPSSTRFFGSSHIYRLIPKRQSITPVLIARAAEDSSHIYGRILSGGAYTLSLASSRGEALSRVVLADKNSRATTILEAASYLIGIGKSLSQKEVKTVNVAAEFITALPQPPLPELYAALALENHLIQRATFSDISYLQTFCSAVGSTHLEYISGAATAHILHDASLVDTCLKTAKLAKPLIVSSEMLPVIENATPSAQDINSSMDVLSQDAYALIQPSEEETSFNSILEGLTEPTPTPMDYSDVKF